MRKSRLRTEVVIAVAATVISVCALITTVYQTYILQQQQHAVVWPRLHLSNSWWIRDDDSHYRLTLENNGVGPAIIQQVVVSHRNDSINNFGELALSIAKQHNLSDTLTFQDYSDLRPDMVIPQQEKINLLLLYHKAIVRPFVNELLTDKTIRVKVRYESLYGETWEVTYPETSHRKVD